MRLYALLLVQEELGIVLSDNESLKRLLFFLLVLGHCYGFVYLVAAATTTQS